ncbi:MAG: UDP-N-acetylmuramate dehydrogenase [Ilumatobacteraceae bacterium]
MVPDDTTDYTRTTRSLDRVGLILGARVRRGEPLAALTTYKVGGSAALYLRARSIDDLHAAANVLRDHDVPVLVIGRGSNLLVSDEGFPGLVITLGDFADAIDLPAPGERAYVTAGANVLLPVLARRCGAHGLTGMEWAVGVPGSIGGAVRMNAGGHGSDMASSLTLAKVFHLRKGIVANVTARDLGLRFRGSDLQSHHVVLSASVELSWGNVAASEREMAEIVRWRREHQPGGHNAGSVFVNPASGDRSAGAIIDSLGLRGLRIGSAEVSTKHANFIQVDDGGRAEHVALLMAEVRRRVHDATGIDLRSEIKLVGFDPELAADAGATVADAAPTTDTSRLEQVFGGGMRDPSITMSALTPPIPDAVREELRELFADATSDTPRPEETGALMGDATGGDLRTGGNDPDFVVVDDADDVADDDDDEGRNIEDDVDGVTAGVTVGVGNGGGDSGEYVVDRGDIGGAEGDLTDASVASGPVVINDDELRLPHERTEGSAAILTFAPTVPTQREGRRVRLRRRIRPNLLLVSVSVLGLLLVGMIVLASPLFGVRQIDVNGARYVDTQLLSRVEESMRGTSVFTVDLDSARRRLEGDPWVRSARLNWYLPDRVVIDIAERTPVAWFVGVDNRARIIDMDGQVLAVEDGQPVGYRRISGVGPNLTPGSLAAPVYRAAAQVAISLPDELDRRVESITVYSPDSLGLALRGDTEVIFGSPNDLRNKMSQALVALRRQDPATIARIDVSGGQPVITSR